MVKINQSQTKKKGKKIYSKKQSKSFNKGVWHSKCHHCCCSWTFLHCFLLLHCCLLLFPKGITFTFTLVFTFTFYLFKQVHQTFCHQTYFCSVAIEYFLIHILSNFKFQCSVLCTFGSKHNAMVIFLYYQNNLTLYSSVPCTILQCDAIVIFLYHQNNLTLYLSVPCTFASTMQWSDLFRDQACLLAVLYSHFHVKTQYFLSKNTFQMRL